MKCKSSYGKIVREIMSSSRTKSNDCSIDQIINLFSFGLVCSDFYFSLSKTHNHIYSLISRKPCPAERMFPTKFHPFSSTDFWYSPTVTGSAILISLLKRRQHRISPSSLYLYFSSCISRRQSNQNFLKSSFHSPRGGLVRSP